MPPRVVLQAQALDLEIVRAQYIVVLGRHRCAPEREMSSVSV
jgi:hypothetical protein